MTGPEEEPPSMRRTQLEQKLLAVDERLRREMIARGFDPAQQDNLALTGSLAKLYMERQSLLIQLEERNKEGR